VQWTKDRFEKIVDLLALEVEIEPPSAFAVELIYIAIRACSYKPSVKTRRWECDRTGSRTHVLWVHDWDCTTHLKRSAVMSGTGIHSLIYRDICVAATAHNTVCAGDEGPFREDYRSVGPGRRGSAWRA